MKLCTLLEIMTEVLFLVLALSVNNIFTYILFIICVFTYIRKSRISLRALWNIAIFSVILPDNYSSLLLMIIPATIASLHSNIRQQLKYNDTLILGILLIILAILSTVVHMVSIINIIFSIIFFAPIFFAFLLMCSETLRKSIDFYKNSLDRVMRIEAIATLINFVLLILGQKNGFDDWSTGTLGVAQQSQLFLIFTFYLLVQMLLYRNKTRTMKNKLWSIICFLCILSTNCWTLFGIIGGCILFGYLTTLDKNTIKRWGTVTLIGLVFVAVLGGKIYDSSVGQQVFKIITDDSYRAYRVPKLDAYYETFIKLPQTDTEFFLIGNGMGWYSSRAALACSGVYMDAYKEMFSPSMSKYTGKYIYPVLVRAYYNSATDYGSVLARPYSSIISLMGETGILGILLFFTIVYKIGKRYGNGARLILLAWLGACFVENYFEYSKIILVLLMCVYIVDESDIKRKYKHM